MPNEAGGPVQAALRFGAVAEGGSSPYLSVVSAWRIHPAVTDPAR